MNFSAIEIKTKKKYIGNISNHVIIIMKRF